MSTILVSFIGKGWPAEKGHGDKHTGYRTATYAFAAEESQCGIDVTTALFGAALLNRLHSMNRPVAKWLVMGTAQSMWDALYEAAPTEERQLRLIDSEIYKKVSASVRDGKADQSVLDEWQRIVSAEFRDTESLFRLVGPADTRESQYRIWQALTETVSDGDKIILDITNGFRHQPVIASFMVMLLRWLRGVEGVDLYYGALDMAALNRGKAPVLKLTLCNEILQATEATATYKHTGSYSQIVRCINPTGLDREFQQFIFLDGIQRDVTDLARRLRKGLSAARQPVDAIKKSLTIALNESLDVAADRRLSERLKGKALFSFKHKQYFQAIALLYEAIRCAACEKYGLGDAKWHAKRKQAEELLREELGYLRWSDKPTNWPMEEVFNKVAHLRNAVLHGTQGEYREINAILDSEIGFRKVFQAGLRLFDAITPGTVTTQSYADGTDEFTSLVEPKDIHIKERIAQATRLTLLNTSILTEFGAYRYEPLATDGAGGIEEAKAVLAQFRQAGKPIQSAIGHQATAELLSALLDYPVAANRMEFRQTIEDLGLVFKLKMRAPEGMILTREELEAIGYEFGLLTRVE